MVRTEVDARDGCARLGEAGLHPVGEAGEGGFVVVSAPDARLVGDHDEQVACLREGAGGLKDARNPVELLDLVDVGVIDVDHAVTVEKCGLSHHSSTFGKAARRFCMYSRVPS